MSIPGRMLRVIVSLGAVTIVVAVCVSIPHTTATAVVLVLLLTILIIASRWDFWEAAAATGLGGGLLAYFFLPPAGWRIESIEQWMVFFTFLVVALLASHSAARAKHKADEAMARSREVERLYGFGQALRLENSPGSMVAAALDSLTKIFEVDGAAFCDSGSGTVTRSGPQAGAFSEDQLRDVARGPDLFTESTTGSLYASLHSEHQVFGSLAVRGGGMSQISFRAVVDRIEAELEKLRAYEDLRRAEETKRNQELKTALLDSLVHEVKTPLSVIKTSVSSLLSVDSDPFSRRELLSLINEEADQLDASISEVFWTARIEAGALQSGKGPHDIRSVVHEV